MTRPFDITNTNDALTLDASGRGKIVFTVTNTSPKPLRGTLRVRGLDSSQPGWFTVGGESERDFPAGVAHQVEVEVKVPPGTPPSKFRMRLDALSVANPDDDFTEGPAVAVTIPPVEIKKPTGMPWWVWVVIAVVLLIVLGVVGYLVLRKPGPKPPDTPASAASTPTVPPVVVGPTPVPPVEFNDPRIQVAEGALPLDLCREWGANCGKPAADAFCASKGAGVAAKFNVAQNSPPTVVIGTKQVCRDPSCDRITWVQCVRVLGPNIRFRTEILRGKSIELPVDK
jgi:hypothetical protein